MTKTSKQTASTIDLNEQHNHSISTRSKVVVLVCLILVITLICIYGLSSSNVSADNITTNVVTKSKTEALNEEISEKKLKDKSEGKIQYLLAEADINQSKIEVVSEKYQQKNEKYTMTLRQLEQAGYIDALCTKHNMSKKWFDRISLVESSYGKHIPNGSYNAWGWGIYGDKVTKLGSNWYESSERFIKQFVKRYGTNPSKRAMQRYCPWGAYDKFF